MGILLLGKRTVDTVGNKITKLTPSKSFCTQIGAAAAVLSSSVLGLPVSTSHCLVGSVAGVGCSAYLLGNKRDLDFAVLKKVVIGWVVTIPLAMAVAVVLFYTLESVVKTEGSR